MILGVVFNFRHRMDQKFYLSTILVIDKFTSYASRALEIFLRSNQLNFSVRYIVALRFNDKCLVSDTKIPINNSFAFNDNTI